MAAARLAKAAHSISGTGKCGYTWSRKLFVKFCFNGWCAVAEDLGSASATPVGPAQTAVWRLRSPRVDAGSMTKAVRGCATCSETARAMAGVCTVCTSSHAYLLPGNPWGSESKSVGKHKTDITGLAS